MGDHKRPLNRSITMWCIVFIIILCIILSLANLSIYKNYVYEDYRGYIDDILDYTMSVIDAEDLEKCIETGEESEQYKKTLKSMDNLMDKFKDIHYLYVIKPLNTDETGNMYCVMSAERYYDRYVDTEGNLYLGWISDDEYSPDVAQQFMDVMHSKSGKGDIGKFGDEVTYFVDETEWGKDYTGALPVRDTSGRGIAVLAVDVDISFLDAMIKEYASVNIGIIIFAGAVFIIFFLMWSRRNITEPIRELEKRAVGFADKSHGQRDVSALTFDAPERERDDEIKSLSNAIVTMTGDMRDYVTEIINAEKRAASMQELAIRDPLTGIRNRTAYDHEIRTVGDKIRAGDTNYGLAVVDLNYLKTINDTYGHEKGDISIVTLCRLVCATFKHSSVFRIGGDEFVIILHGQDLENYHELAAELYAEIDALASDETLEPWEKVSAAVGAAFYEEGSGEDMESLFKRADQDMYENKKRMKTEKGI